MMRVGHYEIKSHVYKKVIEKKKKMFVYEWQARKWTCVFILSSVI